jgi:membrane protein implicated in regulation of membrane protease activity
MGIIEIIVAVLIIMWIGGFAFHVGGSLIHALLVLALIIFIIRLFRKNT